MRSGDNIYLAAPPLERRNGEAGLQYHPSSFRQLLCTVLTLEPGEKKQPASMMQDHSFRLVSKTVARPSRGVGTKFVTNDIVGYCCPLLQSLSKYEQTDKTQGPCRACGDRSEKPWIRTWKAAATSNAPNGQP